MFRPAITTRESSACRKLPGAGPPRRIEGRAGLTQGSIACLQSPRALRNLTNPPMAPICHHKNRKEGLEDNLVNKLDFLKIPYKMRILCSIVITHTVKGSWQWGWGSTMACHYKPSAGEEGQRAPGPLANQQSL